MDKEKLKERVEQLKRENDQANQQLTQLDQARNQLLQEILIRNGRILELERLLATNN